MNKSSYYLLLILIFIAQAPTVTYADSKVHEIIKTTDLAQLGTDSGKTRRPILLLMSRANCTFCINLKREILNPMVLSGYYDSRIIIRELMIDSDTKILGFDGHELDASIMASKYGVSITPTMLFLGSDGTEQTERIVGMSTVDYFPFYIDQTIDKAVKKLNGE